MTEMSDNASTLLSVPWHFISNRKFKSEPADLKTGNRGKLKKGNTCECL